MDNIRDIFILSEQLDKWKPSLGKRRTPPNEDDAAIFTQLATCILNLRNLPMTDVSLEQRVKLRETLAVMKDQMRWVPIDRKVNSFYQEKTGRQDLVDNADNLIEAIDQWSAQHYREDEGQWASMTADEIEGHRQTHLTFARKHLHDFLMNPETLQQLTLEPEKRASWTVRTRTMIETFPELFTESQFLQIFENQGGFSELLSDLVPLLFDHIPNLAVFLEKDGEPLVKWLQTNNWLRERDPNWISAQMTKEDRQGNTLIHLAAIHGSLNFILALSPNILMAGMERRNHAGLTPLACLLFADPKPGIDRVFDQVVQKLGDIKRKAILEKLDVDGNNLLHLIGQSPNLMTSAFITSLAKYPNIFHNMLISKNQDGLTPIQVMMNSPASDHILTILQVLNIPANINDVKKDSQAFVSWLKQQMKRVPPPTQLLILPLLRGDPQELQKAVKDSPKLYSTWLTNEDTIKKLLMLPEEVWQSLLTLRDKDDTTPLEHLASRGDVTFWKTLEEHDYELPAKLLCEPSKYGTPLHKAAAAGQVSFLQTVILDFNEDNPDLQRKLLGLRDSNRQTATHCARSAEENAAMTFLLERVELPLLYADYEGISAALDTLGHKAGHEVPPIKQNMNPEELSRECIQWRLNILQLQNEYFIAFANRENKPIHLNKMKLVFPSLKHIEKGSIIPNYFGDGTQTSMKNAPETVDFAEILIPLISKLPIGDTEPIDDLDVGVGGKRAYSVVRNRLIAFISNLAANRQMTDAYNVPIPPDLKEHLTNMLRHLALYVEKAQEAIYAAPPGKDQELLDQLNKEMRNELIADFGIGLFHCLDGVATHMRQLYDFVTNSEAITMEDQLQIALSKYRSNQFDLIISKVASRGMHEATTHRYYRGLLGAAVGLGAEMSTMSAHYAGFAERGHDASILERFNKEHTPEKIVNYVCGLLNDKKDKTLNKSLVLAWFHEHFSSQDLNKIMDDQGKWRPEAVGLFLTAMGIIKPKNQPVNEKRILLMTLEHGNVDELRQALAIYSAPLPNGLLHTALDRGDPEIMKEMVEHYKQQGTLDKALKECDATGKTVILRTLCNGQLPLAEILLDDGQLPPMALQNTLLEEMCCRGTAEGYKALRALYTKYDPTNALWLANLKSTHIFNAYLNERWDIVELQLLIEPLFRNNPDSGYQAFETAMGDGRTDVAERLLKIMTLESICHTAKEEPERLEWIRNHLDVDTLQRFEEAIAA